MSMGISRLRIEITIGWELEIELNTLVGMPMIFMGVVIDQNSFVTIMTSLLSNGEKKG
jgi:hypothetical protein